MAFRKVLSISCEDQWYRRCAQIAILESLHFPVFDDDFYHVIWAKPFEEYGAEPLAASLSDMGFENWSKVTSLPENKTMRYYDLSLIEAQIRALNYCVELNQNVLIVADDVYFMKKHSEMYDALKLLVDSTKNTEYPVGFCQLDYGKDTDGTYAEARKHTAILRSSKMDFLRGVMGQSTSAVFVTPHGAKQVLENLKHPECHITTLEVMPPRFWYKEPWMYTVASRTWVNYIRSMNGHSIAAKIDEHEHLAFGRVDGINRRDKSYRLLEKYRIPYDTNS